MKVFVTILLLLLIPVLAPAGPVGNTAPDFTLTDLNGKTIALQQLKGKVVVLDFWAPWCDQCREGMPAIDTLFKKYTGKGLVIIGVDIDSSENLLKDFLQKVPVTFTIAMDGKGVMRRAYRFRSLPTAFIIGKDGVIRYMHLGYSTDFLQVFEKEIVELLKQP